MPSHMIDSIFFRDFFGTGEMRAIFTDEALLQKWLDVEAALARADARLGIVPAEAAKEISAKAYLKHVDVEAIRKGIAQTVHPIVPVVRELANACDGDAGQFIHWGATTQDIMDTAVVLQLKD